ncbi:hypothetical protein [Streptomyces anulatus]|uniref:hypothetical protein n=1 Tax=Streptomyces anulatus TaxID=1892 RepID=UPI002F90ABB8
MSHRGQHRDTQTDELGEQSGFQPVGAETGLQVVQPHHAPDCGAVDHLHRGQQVRASGRSNHPVLGQLGTECFEAGPRLACGGVSDHQHQAALVRCPREPGANDCVLIPGNVWRNGVAGVVGA